MTNVFEFHLPQFGYANISLGCPACSCNISGSIENFCDRITGQCLCKMGVEGLQCDECIEGFYGHSTDGCQGKLNLPIVSISSRKSRKSNSKRNHTLDLSYFIYHHDILSLYHKTDKFI